MPGPRRSSPLPAETTLGLFDSDSSRNRAAATRYGTPNPALVAGAVTLSNRMQRRTPREIRRDDYGSIDSDIELATPKSLASKPTRSVSRSVRRRR